MKGKSLSNVRQVSSASLVQNLNAQYLNGRSISNVIRNGTSPNLENFPDDMGVFSIQPDRAEIMGIDSTVYQYGLVLGFKDSLSYISGRGAWLYFPDHDREDVCMLMRLHYGPSLNSWLKIPSIKILEKYVTLEELESILDSDQLEKITEKHNERIMKSQLSDNQSIVGGGEIQKSSD